MKQRYLIIDTGKNGTVALSTNFASNFEELEATVKSMMEKSQNLLANGQQKLIDVKFAERKVNPMP